ncbi:MAG: hypothetical protein ACXWWK_09660 [Gemmatimonadales bacterium]
MTIGKRVGIGNPLRLVTLGVGALASPRYAPAGLLVHPRRPRNSFCWQQAQDL